MKPQQTPRKFKKTKIGHIPGDWKVKRLGEVVEGFINDNMLKSNINNYEY